MRQLIILIFVFFICSSIDAQSPESFNYQGVVRNKSGEPLSSKAITLQIAVVEESVEGNVVYEETHSVTTDKSGLFNIHIGAGTPSEGTIGSIKWGSNLHFLQVSIDDNGGNDFRLLGTTQLLSVPYALYAKNGSKWNENDTGITYAAGNVVVGSEKSTKAKLEVKEEVYGNSSAIKFGGVYTSDSTQVVAAHHLSSTRDFVINVDSVGIDKNLKSSLRAFSLRKTRYNHLDNHRSLMIVDLDGNVGIGNYESPYTRPKAKLEVKEGDVFVQQQGRGVIMRSDNGSCWRLRPNNEGKPVFEAVYCD